MIFVHDSKFEVNEPTVISETIDGETVIINLASGTYFSLKRVGAAIWAAIQQSASLGTIAAMIRSGYDIEKHDIEEHIAALIQRLTEEGLVRPASGEACPSIASAPSPEEPLVPFEPPMLEKFTDMEAMLLLDPVHDVDEKGWPNLPQWDSRADA
jgi:hypothetical protein